MSAFVANLAVAAGILLCGVAAILALVGVVSYRRLGAPRLLWIAIALVLLAVQGAFLAAEAFRLRGEAASGPFPFPILLGLAAALALYTSVVKR